MSFFEGLGKGILPEGIRKKIKEYLQKTGRNEVPYSRYGSSFFISIFISIGIYLFLIFPLLKTSNIPTLVIGSFIGLSLIEFAIIILSGFMLWLYYEFTIFRRTREIEEVLPDFLQEVSVNLRAGMSFDKALWNSIEPEVGVLEKEIEVVAKKVMAGKDTEKALEEFSEKYNSTLLKESMDMILIGIRSGGNIADLIDKIVENVKDASFLRKELVAYVTSYIIFITLVAVIISPILFALSFNLMEIIQGLGQKLSTSATSGTLFSGNSGNYESINPDDFILFSKICVVIISGISSMIVADLREGSIKAGLKYIFLFSPISYFVYVIMLKVLTVMFGILA